MSEFKQRQPTSAELAILNILWDHGPCTVREVNTILNRTQETGYTTTLKHMQIMTEKGLVSRDESSRTHIYHPRLKQQHAQQQIVRNLLDRVFNGSPRDLIMQALSARKASAEELAEIQELINNLEEENK